MSAVGAAIATQPAAAAGAAASGSELRLLESVTSRLPRLPSHVRGPELRLPRARMLADQRLGAQHRLVEPAVRRRLIRPGGHSGHPMLRGLPVRAQLHLAVLREGGDAGFVRQVRQWAVLPAGHDQPASTPR